MDTGTPIDPLLRGANDIIAAAPFIGTALVAMASTIVYLWRENKAERKQAAADLAAESERHDRELVLVREKYDAAMADLRNKHSVEMAEQRRLIDNLQELRLTEIKAAFADVVKATGTVEQALAILHGGAAR